MSKLYTIEGILEDYGGLTVNDILKDRKTENGKLIIDRLLEKQNIAYYQKASGSYIINEQANWYLYTQYENDFKKIVNYSDLIGYLVTKNVYVSNEVCHYTSIDNLRIMINGKKFKLGNPRTMNDRFEYNQFDARDWKSIFFASFMDQKSESIAMWSMYGQPWEKGIKISIPIYYFRKWIDETNAVELVQMREGKEQTKIISIGKEARLLKHFVAYSNMSGNEKKDVSRHICCGTSENIIFKDHYQKSMTGFVKHEAWSYEREVRLRLDLGKQFDAEYVLLPIPDYILENMSVTYSPRFNDTKVSGIKGVDSLFSNKLGYIYCDKCKKTIQSYLYTDNTPRKEPTNDEIDILTKFLMGQ